MSNNNILAATIVRGVLPGWWIVKDAKKNCHRVASAKFWRRGEQVSVVDGVITERSDMTNKAEEFVV